MGVADDLAPSFTQKPQLRQEDDGNRLIFECQLVSSPKPDIAWFRGETELSQDDRTNFKVQSVGTNKFLVVLELDDVIETDAGLYKVKAKNKMGEVAASINLNFSRKFHFHDSIDRRTSSDFVKLFRPRATRFALSLSRPARHARLYPLTILENLGKQPN